MVRWNSTIMASSTGVNFLLRGRSAYQPGKGTNPGKGTTRLDHGEARVMKMAEADSALRIRYAKRRGCGVAIESDGSDMGKMVPMNEAWRKKRPRQHLADGGYPKFDDVEALEKAGVEVYAFILVRPGGPTMRQPSRLARAQGL